MIARQTHWILTGIVVLALVVRAIHFAALADTALPDRPLLQSEMDDYAFYAWAQTILEGDWLGRDTYHPYFQWMKARAPLETWYEWWGGKEIFHQAPLYPYLLAGFLGVCNDDVSCVLLIQLLIGGLQPVVLYALASNWWGPRAGLFAAGLTALYGPFIFHQGYLLRDWLSPILEPLTLLAVLSAGKVPTVPRWMLAGGMLALAFLLKETAILLLPILLIWLVIRRDSTWRTCVTSTAWCLAGMVLVLSPLFIRNLLVGAPVLSISTRPAEVFVLINTANREKTPTSTVLERTGGDFWTSLLETLKTYQGDATRMAGSLLTKVRQLVDPFEIPNNASYAYGLDVSPVLSWMLEYQLVFPLGLAGMLWLVARGRGPFLLWGYGAVSMIGLLMTLPLARYRLVIVPFFIVLGAFLLDSLISSLRSRQGMKALGQACLVGAIVLIQQGVAPLPAKGKKIVYPPDYLLSAQAYAAQHRWREAAEEMARLRNRATNLPHQRQAFPIYAAGYHEFMARHFLERGRNAEAGIHLARGWEDLQRYRRVGGNISYLYYNYGTMAMKLGAPQIAHEAFEEFLARQPNHPKADRIRKLLVTLESSRPRNSMDNAPPP